MNRKKDLKLWALGILIFLIVFGGLFRFYSPSEAEGENSIGLDESPNFVILEENTLTSLSNPNDPPLKVTKTVPVIITAYSSTPWETDDTPYITAAGTEVRDGIVANNLLPFGTKIRIPELYNDKVFVVEDRMNWKKSNYQVDIWFPDYHQALSFGVKRTHIEVLEM
jgi:3D (Asp-Asp-Asp) domain-containing protein